MINICENQTIYNLYGLNKDSLESLSKRVNLPYLYQFMESIKTLQEKIGSGRVHRYFIELITHGRLEFISPKTGSNVKSGNSIILNDKTTIFSVPDEPEFLLAVGDLSCGYCLCSVILFQENIILKLAQTDWGFSERHIPRLNAIIKRIGWKPAQSQEAPVLVVGDANYAHHAWNQLSALEVLTEQDLPHPSKMIVTDQPFGSIKEIFPEFSDLQVENCPDYHLEDMNRLEAVFLPVGSIFLTATTIERLIKIAKSKLSPSCKALLDSINDAEGPILWLSVRTRNRTAINQHELLTEIGASFLKEAPYGTIIIDGFSLPADFEQKSGYHKTNDLQVVKADVIAAENIKLEIRKRILSGQIHIAIGYSVLDSIYLARKANFYFCHHGTVQHKIGWFSTVNGVVHCNQITLRTHPANWVASKSELAALPQYIPIEYVEDTELNATDEFRHLFNYENYLIKDIFSVTQFFLNHAKISGIKLSTQVPATVDEQRSKVIENEFLGRILCQNRELEEKIFALEASTSWKITSPLRKIGKKFPFIAKFGCRLLKLSWWTLTFQLHHRYYLYKNNKKILKTEDLKYNDQDDVIIDPKDIHINSSNKPTVSVIISTYGQFKSTLICLKSIENIASKTSLEVIVVDDAYPDADNLHKLKQVNGIKIIENKSNLGFLLSCNQASIEAKGKYIYMLNNDTELQAGAIDSLVELLEEHPEIGMAGSKLLYPNGVLQEAGGVIWNDASGWNVGKGDDPTVPAYNYLREVDYCSGASLMLRSSLFRSMGGFDELFIPAYYEDTDLAFRLRAEGLKVFYEPRSVVLHHEGMSHGTDESVGVKAHQALNQLKMLKRWNDVLVRDHLSQGDKGLRARDHAKHKKVILVIDHYTPEPDRDAGSRSMMGILLSLLDAGWVVKFWPMNRAYSPIYTSALEKLGIEVLDHRWPGNLDSWLNENRINLDHILVSRPTVANEIFRQLIIETDVQLNFYGHDLHFARMERQAKIEKNGETLVEAEHMKQLELQIWKLFDVIIYPSEEEAAIVRNLSPKTNAHAIIPFFCDFVSIRKEPASGLNILFVAGFAHAPNVDAAKFLVLEIIPILEKSIGSVSVTLAGSHPTDEVLALAGENVEVTGYIPEEKLRQLYHTHRVAVVPLRYGAGVKGKVVEALGYGLPLVTTPIGAQGIVNLELTVPVCLNADDIAEPLKILLTDDEEWMQQSRRQTDFAQKFYSRSAMKDSLLKALKIQ